MQRSYSHTYLNSQVSPQMTLPPPNIVLQGNLLKKVPDYNSAAWNGLALQQAPYDTQRKSERRWKESEESRRTIDPSYAKEESKLCIPNTNHQSVGNLTEMINRGFSRETLGNLNRRVTVSGKSLNVNAMSYANINASSGIYSAYKGLHPVNSIEIERRQKKPSLTGETKNASSIFGSEEYAQERRSVRIKPEYMSNINELPGYLKNPEPERRESNPNVKFLRNTATSNEKGETVERKGPKQEIVPSTWDRNPTYAAVGQESELNPYTKGKMKNYNAEDKLLRGTVEERDLVGSKRGKPASARNMFTSSFTFA